MVVGAAGLRTWVVGGVRVVRVGVLLILMSSRAKIPFIPRCACISCRTLVVLLVVGDSGLNSLNRAWSSIFFFDSPSLFQLNANLLFLVPWYHIRSSIYLQDILH